MNPPLRFVVCGTTFGRVHLAALRRAAPWGRLVGILARGSDRSIACAREYGVPLYNSVADLPDEVDAACVAVRAGVAGGEGTGLAGELLARGIHVLQENPIHHDELVECLRLARRNRVLYRLNNHYSQLVPVRRFIRAAHALYRHGPPRYVEAGTGIQVAFALVDLLGQALPALRPWGFADSAPTPPQLSRLLDASPPLRSLDGVFAGVPVHLRVHNQLDPDDPDNHAHLLHRISIGTDAGNLTLFNTHGPVLWSPRLHVLDGGVDADPGLMLPSTDVLGSPCAPSFAEVLTEAWPDAMRRSLAEFTAAVRADEDPMRRGQYHLTLCRIWQDITGRLGQPEIIHSAAPPPLAAADLDREPRWEHRIHDGDTTKESV